ncbi:MAG: transcription antitermination factor NusB [Nitrospinae bacterium]|nr:transcription antitermination factor NusB [Nitrospinota bacterium]
MGARHKSREAAVAILYQLDMVREKDPGKAVAEYFATENPESAQMEFVSSMVTGVVSRIDEIDAKIGPLLVNWEFARLGYMERAILRLGTYEILFDATIPGAVAVDEAVELAKDFCDADSAGFINGVLDKLAKEKQPSGS